MLTFVEFWTRLELPVHVSPCSSQINRRNIHQQRRPSDPWARAGALMERLYSSSGYFLPSYIISISFMENWVWGSPVMRLQPDWAAIRARISIMMFGSVKFSPPLNGDGDFLLPPPSLLGAQTMAWNFNSGSQSQAGFSCLCQCAGAWGPVCDLHSFPDLPSTPDECWTGCVLLLAGVDGVTLAYLFAWSAVSVLAVPLYVMGLCEIKTHKLTGSNGFAETKDQSLNLCLEIINQTGYFR